MTLNMIYKCELIEWMEVCSEQCYKCQIHDRIQDQVFLKTAAWKSPPLIFISIKNSDENVTY